MFRCKRCGKCCIYSMPQFDKDECKRVAYIAEQMGIDFVMLNLGGVDTFFTSKTFERFATFLDNLRDHPELGKEEPALVCEFLEMKDGVSNCTIYDLRPTVCREFGYGENPILQCLNREEQTE